MSLADLAHSQASRPAKKCATCWLIETLPADGDNGSDALRAALASPASHQAISSELYLMGYKIAAQSVGRHRAGRCIQ